MTSISTNIFHRSLVTLSLAAAILFYCACSKDSKSKSVNNIINGTWEGKWGDGPQSPQYFIKFNIKPNGQLERVSEQGGITATGTWSLNGVQFEASYTHLDGEEHKIAGLYTDFDGVIIGTWGYSPSKVNGGSVELEKQ